MQMAMSQMPPGMGMNMGMNMGGMNRGGMPNMGMDGGKSLYRTVPYVVLWYDMVSCGVMYRMLWCGVVWCDMISCSQDS